MTLRDQQKSDHVRSAWYIYRKGDAISIKRISKSLRWLGFMNILKRATELLRGKISIGWSWTLPTFSKPVHPEFQGSEIPTSTIQGGSMSLINKIKLLFKLRQPVSEFAGEVKQAHGNWKHLSFWISVTATLGAIAAELAGFIPATTALIVTTAITVAYNILRGIQNADQTGTVPIFLSTRFWIGILGIVAAGFQTLQAGGINSTWVVSASGFIAAIMAGAQNLGAQQPVAGK